MIVWVIPFFYWRDGFRLPGSRLWCGLQRCEFEHVSIPVSSFRPKWESFSFVVVLPFGMQGLVTGD